MREHVQFEKYSVSQWQQLVESTLKGRSLQDLQTETYEGLTLEPLYTERPSSDGFHPSRGWKLNHTWYTAQQVWAKTPEEAYNAVQNELMNGSEVIALKEDVEGQWSTKQIKELLSLQEKPHLFILDSEVRKKWLPSLIAFKDSCPIEGVFGYDFISGEAQLGRLVNEQFLTNWVEEINELSHAQPSLKSIVVSTVPYHHSGASAVQELAAALSESSWIINHLAQEGWKVEDIVEKMHIQFAAGSTFFLEIAKIRAFRALWSHFAECYQVGDLPVSVGSQSSPLTKTIQDPQVNILRAGNEAFAAALGGVNYQHVEPYDSLNSIPSSLAVRVARNIQLLLKEETFLTGIADPGGGSYYIETITKQLAEKAWTFFLEIEELGGVQDALSEGFIQNKINEVWEQRVMDTAVRKATIVGTNKYAPVNKLHAEPQNKTDQGGAIKPLQKHRLSEQWEALLFSLQGETLSENMRPVEIVCLGEVKEHKERMDFVTGILNTVGLPYQMTTVLKGSPVQIICGTNEAYTLELDRLLSEKQVNQSVYVAGKLQPEQVEKWKNSGLTDSICNGKNIISFLKNVVKQLKEVSSDETSL
ncbi:methylmalonyl-CoA mutase family protein [Jeotgalibacillus proteolyticus]|uniref:methylmalonyl-CoA mutase family protein n=1 Tax=Jeotgalibacillus proteolyticus TaxID=2082395 RepID=UPI003CF3A01F